VSSPSAHGVRNARRAAGVSREELTQILISVVRDVPTPLRTIAPDLPPPVVAAIEQALRKGSSETLCRRVCFRDCLDEAARRIASDDRRRCNHARHTAPPTSPPGHSSPPPPTADSRSHALGRHRAPRLVTVEDAVAGPGIDTRPPTPRALTTVPTATLDEAERAAASGKTGTLSGGAPELEKQKTGRAFAVITPRPTADRVMPERARDIELGARARPRRGAT